MAQDNQRKGVNPEGAADAPSGRTLPKRAEELEVLYRLTDRLYRASSLSEVFDAALDSIIAALGCDRASILLFDSAGVMQFVAWRGLSDDYRTALEGHSPWKVGELDPEPVFVEDIERTDEPEWIKARIRKEGIRGLGFIPLVARRAVIGKFMTYYAAPRAMAPNEANLAINIARQLGFSLERARSEDARREVEVALRESEERFRLMAESAPVMIWVSQADGSCLHLNRMLREFWDVEEAELDSFDWRTMIHPEDVLEVTRQMTEALARRAPVTMEARYRNARGDYRVLATDARPRFGPKGEFLGMIGANVDISERKESETRLELLLAELNHRVKNMLAVVQGIARQTFRDTRSLPDAKRSFEGRLMVLAVAHDLLTRGNWESAPLEQLARNALQQRGDRQRISLSGPHVPLDPKKTLAFTMALHELYTNAIKYGALSKESGRISVDWRLSGPRERRLEIVWREEGAPIERGPVRTGFGTRLIEQVLTQDLGGEVMMDFRPDGLVCTIRLPLP